MAHWSIIAKGGTVELKRMADLVGDLVHPAEIAANSPTLATPQPARSLGFSPNSRDSTGQALATPEADEFWQSLTARVDECDRLINELCDLREDDDEHRAALLEQRKRMAPTHLDSDIAYLKREIHNALTTKGKHSPGTLKPGNW